MAEALVMPTDWTRDPRMSLQPSDNEQVETCESRAGLEAAYYRSSFLALPAEIRNRIYAFALVEQNDIKIRSCCCLEKVNKGEQLALTQTCRQIRRESLTMFYELNTFSFEIPLPRFHYCCRYPAFGPHRYHLHKAKNFRFTKPDYSKDILLSLKDGLFADALSSGTIEITANLDCKHTEPKPYYFQLRHLDVMERDIDRYCACLIEQIDSCWYRLLLSSTTWSYYDPELPDEKLPGDQIAQLLMDVFGCEYPE